MYQVQEKYVLVEEGESNSLDFLYKEIACCAPIGHKLLNMLFENTEPATAGTLNVLKAY